MEERRKTPRPNSNELEGKVDRLTNEVKDLKSSVEELVSAWNGAKGFLGMVKWLAALSASLAVIYAAWKNQHGL